MIAVPIERRAAHHRIRRFSFICFRVIGRFRHFSFDLSTFDASNNKSTFSWWFILAVDRTFSCCMTVSLLRFFSFFCPSRRESLSSTVESEQPTPIQENRRRKPNERCRSTKIKSDELLRHETSKFDLVLIDVRLGCSQSKSGFRVEIDLGSSCLNKENEKTLFFLWSSWRTNFGLIDKSWSNDKVRCWVSFC